MTNTVWTIMEQPGVTGEQIRDCGFAAGRRFGRLALLLAALTLLLPGAAQARKWYHMDGPGHWVVVDEAQAKPRRSTLSLSITANDITMNVDFMDPDGAGFLDPDQGQNRRDALVAALNTIAGELKYPGATLDVTVQESENKPDADYIAYGWTSFPAGLYGFSNGAAFERLTNGGDIDPTIGDLVCQVNFGQPLYSGVEPPPSDQYDLTSVLLHEFTHAMGYLSLAYLDVYGQVKSAQNDGNPGTFSRWDNMLVTASGAKLFTAGGRFVGDPAILEGSSPGVYFDGAAAKTFMGGGRPQVFTPSVFNPDSSLSHWKLTMANTIMTPFAVKGRACRVFGPLDLAVLKDLGWKQNIAVVNAVGQGWTRYE